MECLRISVICFILCVTKCLPMSLNEIEEFSSFLEKTAQLDEILKKGTNPDLDEYDDDELISDHAWEESGKFEGDLILNERQRRLIVEDVAEGLSRNGLTDSTKRWPDNEVIYYIQKEHFSEDQVDAIQNGIDDLAKASCVKFRPYKKGDRDAVVIQGSRRGCFSQVGYQGGYQVLNLSGRHPVGRGCFRHGTVVHELLHTLGFYHMQSSPDRDDYINVMWDNIIQPAKHNFRKYNSFSVSDFGVGYDYDSVLHYSRRAFSANGQDTLVPKQSGASIGQRVGLSDKDSQKLNKMYCDADNNNDEESPQKSPPKKKKPKNKPFVGHGIGYHQGKAVVIKLPAAETYKLADTPMFHLFDHFSKAPQAVSPPATAEGTGVGEKVDYNYEPFKYNNDKYEKAISLYADNSNKSNDESRFQYKSDDATFQYEGKKNDSKHLSDEKHKSSENEEKNSSYANKDLDEAFERLGKIIKTHVYPSQTPDFDIYKNNDYGNFYGPEKIISDIQVPKIENEIEKALEYQTALPGVNKETENQKPIVLGNKDDRNNHNMQVEQDEVYSIDDGSSETPQNEEHDYNSSYGTSLPSKKFQGKTSSEPPRNEYHDYDSSYETLKKIRDKAFIKPVYTILQDIKDRNNYNDLDELKDMPISLQSKNNKLYGYIIPLHTKWVNVDREDTEDDNKKFDHESYTKSKEVDASSKLVQHEPESEKLQLFGRLNSGERPYSLFGVLIPLTKKWLQFDYNPYSSLPFSVNDSKYNEDYR